MYMCGGDAHTLGSERGKERGLRWDGPSELVGSMTYGTVGILSLHPWHQSWIAAVVARLTYRGEMLVVTAGESGVVGIP